MAVHCVLRGRSKARAAIPSAMPTAICMPGGSTCALEDPSLCKCAYTKGDTGRKRVGVARSHRRVACCCQGGDRVPRVRAMPIHMACSKGPRAFSVGRRSNMRVDCDLAGGKSCARARVPFCARTNRCGVCFGTRGTSFVPACKRTILRVRGTSADVRLATGGSAIGNTKAMRLRLYERKVPRSTKVGMAYSISKVALRRGKASR